jgi:hypothetical protein
MSDLGSGYIINVGEQVKVKSGDDWYFAKLVDIDMTGMEDTVEVDGEFVKVERTDIYPANINTIVEYKNMKEELNKGICEVTFTKKNGEHRVMPCTLVFDHIPEEHHPKGTGSQHNSQETIAVWCMDKEAWRSFRVDSVTNFERLTGNGRGKQVKCDIGDLL